LNIFCPICKSATIKLQWKSKLVEERLTNISSFECANLNNSRPEILKCTSCKHWFSNPKHWPIDIEEEYKYVVDYKYKSIEHIKFKTFERAAKLTNSFFLRPGNFLEIGSYTGIYLKLMESFGWKGIGIEPSSWATALCQNQGLNVIEGSFESILKKNSLGLYELVVAWDVLEHVVDPINFLEEASRLLKSEGYLIISTLDRSNFLVKLTRSRWPWLITMHLHYFDKESVINIANSLNLKLIQTKAHVHYASLYYILEKTLRHKYILKLLGKLVFLNRIVIPIGFGDVRYFVFKN
jgi:SAM-dependent methyltransferase